MKKETDEYCEKILMVLLMCNKKIRFNELHRTLTNFNAKMSKPTLIEHLKHLIKEETIQRYEEGKQNVSYEINWKRFKQLQKTKELSLILAHQIRNEARFKSMSLRNQTIFVTGMLTLGELLYLKLILLNVLEPENALQNRLSFVFTKKLYNIYTPWLLDSCKKSKENSQKILRHINKQIKLFTETFIEIIPEVTQQNAVPSKNATHNKPVLLKRRTTAKLRTFLKHKTICYQRADKSITSTSSSASSYPKKFTCHIAYMQKPKK